MIRLRSLVAPLAVLVLSTSGLAPAEEITFAAEVDNQKVGLDDTFALTVTVSGASVSQTISPEMPEMPDFDVIGQSSSSNISFVNGQVSASRSIIYTLRPKKQGKFTIPPVKLKYAGTEYRSAPIEVEVVEGSVTGGRRPQRQNPWSPFFDPFEDSQQPRKRYGSDSVLLVTELDRKQVYQGEQATLSLKILTQVSITGLEIEEFPPLTGFWVEDLQVEKTPRGRKVTVNGQEYVEFLVKRSALFPTRAERFTIAPAIMKIQLDGGGFFSSPEVVRRQSKPISLEVQPLPESGRPGTFVGAVGSFGINASIDKGHAVVGDALSLKVAISGRGNIKTIATPSLPPMDDFKVYEPKYSEKITTSGTQMQGEKSWEYVISPKVKGTSQIGPIQLAYFDPLTKTYQVARSKPLSITIEAGEGTAQIPGAPSRTQLRAIREDISFIRNRDVGVTATDGLRGRAPLLILLLVLPPLVNLVVLGYRRQLENRQVDMASYLRGRAYAEFKRALKRTRGLASPGDAKEFYQGLNDALSRYAAHKLSMSPQGLTLQAVVGELQQKSIDPELVQRFEMLWNDAEYGLFAAGKPGVGAMEKLVRQAEETISNIERRL